MELDDLLPKIMIFRSDRDDLCDKCGDLIPSGKERVLVAEDVSYYYHVECSDICPRCIEKFRAEEKMYREYELRMLEEVTKEHEEDDIHSQDDL